MAKIARNFVGKSLYEKAIADFINAATNQDDPYKICAVMAWPIRAMLCANDNRGAKHWYEFAKIKSLEISYPGSKAEALISIFQAIFPMSDEFTLTEADQLIALLSPPIHWRQKRAVKNIVRFLNFKFPEKTKIFADTITDGTVQKLAVRVLELGEKYPVRDF